MSDLIKREDAIKYFAEFLSLNRFADFKNVNIEKLVGKLCERIPTAEPSDSEKPNNCEMPCEECGHWEHGAGDHYYCALLEMGQECYFESKNESTLMFANEPKTEPEVRSNLEPFRADEPQTERSE